MTDNSKKAIEEQYDLCKFEAEEVLANNVHAKRVVVLGRFVNDALTDKALVILEKSAFTTDDVSTGCKTANAGLGEPPPDSPAQKLQNPRKLFASDTRLDMQIRNDIYADFLCYPDRDYNSKFYLLDSILYCLSVAISSFFRFSTPISCLVCTFRAMPLKSLVLPARSFRHLI